MTADDRGTVFAQWMAGSDAAEPEEQAAAEPQQPRAPRPDFSQGASGEHTVNRLAAFREFVGLS